MRLATTSTMAKEGTTFTKKAETSMATKEALTAFWVRKTIVIVMMMFLEFDRIKVDPQIALLNWRKAIACQ